MRSVADFRAHATRAWRRRFPGWLSGDGEPLSWSLQPPSEATALADPDAVAAWASGWRAAEGRGITVEWAERSWRSLGRQRLPARAHADARAVARLIGETASWERARYAAGLLQEQWPDAALREAISPSALGLARLDRQDVDRLVAVLGWLAEHPDSGLSERELPVEGVDTKWYERHRRLVECLLPAVTGSQVTPRRHWPAFRVRLPGEPGDLRCDLGALRGLAVNASRVLICENLTTVVTLPDLADTVAVHGMGFAAPSLADVAWIREADVYYWGDLDSYGFQILGRVRAALPGIRSLMMDEETLDDWRGLAVTEPNPYRGEVGHLTLAELRALAAVRAGDLRLEQERIGRDYARVRLFAALGPSPTT